MKIFKSKIDKLSKRRQTLIAIRDNAERAMRERNAKREAKSQALLNRGQEDWEETNRFMTKIDRELDKLAREIDSEKIYRSDMDNNLLYIASTRALHKLAVLSIDNASVKIREFKEKCND